MSGRVALQSGISDIAGLRGQARRVGNAYQVKLTEEARGKIVVGNTTFLFQFVAPPPPQPRPQLPLAVKGGLASQIDWNLTIIASFSFLLHFGVIGALYSDWMDPVVNDEAVAGGIIDMIKNIPTPPVEVPEAAATGTAPTDSKPSPATTAAVPTKGGGGAKAGPMSASQAAALSAQADQIQMQMLAAFGGGSAVAGALTRGDIPPVDLGSAAASGAGVSASTGTGLNFGVSGQTVRPGGASGGLGSIGTTSADAKGSAGPETRVQGPTGNAEIGATTASIAVANAASVVAKLRPGFRACYNAGLNVDPSMSGKVVLSVKISPNGEVSGVDPSGNSGLSENVVQCLIRKARNAQFDSPGPNGSVLQIPVTFVQQAK
jgi:outer membrane biosynthesis protein TonB